MSDDDERFFPAVSSAGAVQGSLGDAYAPYVRSGGYGRAASDDEEEPVLQQGSLWDAYAPYVPSGGYGRAASDDEDDALPCPSYPSVQHVSETLAASSDDTALRHDTEMLSAYPYGMPLDEDDDDDVVYLCACDPKDEDDTHAESLYTQSISSSDFSTVARRTRDSQHDDSVGLADSVLMAAGTSSDAEEDNG